MGGRKRDNTRRGRERGVLVSKCWRGKNKKETGGVNEKERENKREKGDGRKKERPDEERKGERCTCVKMVERKNEKRQEM